MLPHKVDGEHPAGYSDLLVAAWKLERWKEKKRLSLQPEKDTEISSGPGGAEQSVGSIVYFTNVVELYQGRN